MSKRKLFQACMLKNLSWVYLAINRNCQDGKEDMTIAKTPGHWKTKGYHQVFTSYHGLLLSCIFQEVFSKLSRFHHTHASMLLVGFWPPHFYFISTLFHFAVPRIHITLSLSGGALSILSAMQTLTRCFQWEQLRFKFYRKQNNTKHFFYTASSR